MGLAVAAAVGAGFALAWAWAISLDSYNIWGAFLVAPIFIAVNGILLWQVAQREPNHWFVRIIGFAFAAKMVGTLVRYYFAYVVYDGITDAERYNLAAAFQYRSWREGNITWDLQATHGTQYMELITTAIYTVIGPTTMTAFFVYGAFAFWGAYLLYRAFRIALPEGQPPAVRIARLLPSLDAVLAVFHRQGVLAHAVRGRDALGAAKYFASQGGAFAASRHRRRRAWPHPPAHRRAAVRRAAGGSTFSPHLHAGATGLSKVAGLLVMGAAGWILATQSAELLGTDDLSWQAVTQSLEMAGGRTTQGGSEFTPVVHPVAHRLPRRSRSRSCSGRSRGRPGNVQVLVQSLEGALSASSCAARAWPRLRCLPSLMRRNPVRRLLPVYTACFIVAFSGFANFGILARQRVLMLPLFMVLLALPAAGSPDEGAIERSGGVAPTLSA